MSLLILMFLKSFQFLFCALLIVTLLPIPLPFIPFLSSPCSYQFFGYLLMLNTKSADNYYITTSFVMIVCHHNLYFWRLLLFLVLCNFDMLCINYHTYAKIRWCMHDGTCWIAWPCTDISTADIGILGSILFSTRNTARFAGLFLVPAEGCGPFGPLLGPLAPVH